MSEIEDHAMNEFEGLSRRSALAMGGAALAGTAALFGAGRPALAQDTGTGHDHHGHDASPKAASQHQALVDAAFDCVRRGEACVPHCVETLAKGDTMLAECLESVLGMLPVCTAVARLAAMDAPRLKELAKVCGDICADCEKVCRKHESHHEVCKACADACAAFVKESKKLTGA
jgi:Cys-rich four helix bundle protein (predicted Tat secretion target)